MKIKILLLIVIFVFAWSACEANQMPMSKSAKKQIETKKNGNKSVKFPKGIPVSESAKKQYKERYNPKPKKMVYNPPKKQKRYRVEGYSCTGIGGYRISFDDQNHKLDTNKHDRKKPSGSTPQWYAVPRRMEESIRRPAKASKAC